MDVFPKALEGLMLITLWPVKNSSSVCVGCYTLTPAPCHLPGGADALVCSALVITFFRAVNQPLEHLSLCVLPPCLSGTLPFK